MLSRTTCLPSTRPAIRPCSAAIMSDMRLYRMIETCWEFCIEFSVISQQCYPSVGGKAAKSAQNRSLVSRKHWGITVVLCFLTFK